VKASSPTDSLPLTDLSSPFEFAFNMNIMRPDISEKLKDAITAKLKEMGAELGITHDNELPDYIMVLLANKKTQRQIENDLQLFLAGSTSSFTAWLITVIKKLESLNTQLGLPHAPNNEPSGDAGVTPTERKHVSPLVAQVSTEEPMSMSEGEDFPGSGGTDRSNSSPRNSIHINERENIIDHLKENLYKRPTLSRSNSDKPRNKGKRRDFTKIVDAREILNSKMSQKDVEMDEGDDSSPNEPKDRQIASVMKVVEKRPKMEKEVTIPSMVRVTPRPVRPPESQPSTNLILKAVKDAEKSVATVRPIQKMRDAILEQRMRRAFKTEDTPAPPPIHLKSKRNQPYAVPPRQNPANFSFEEFEDIEVTVANRDTEDEEIKAGVGSLYMGTENEGILRQGLINRFEMTAFPQEEHSPPTAKKQFDRSRLGPRVNDIDSDSPRELSDSLVTSSVDDLNQTVELSKSPDPDSAPVKVRCRFWPNCELGDSCRYHHPTVMCRVFPKCKFGDNCAYIHPPCKFGAQCLNIACVYSHAHAKGRRASLPLSTPKQQRCMFFPNCSNPVCPFLHVKMPCRFGSRCMKKQCEYDHSGIETPPPSAPTAANPFKWSLTRKDL